MGFTIQELKYWYIIRPTEKFLTRMVHHIPKRIKYLTIIDVWARFGTPDTVDVHQLLDEVNK